MRLVMQAFAAIAAASIRPAALPLGAWIGFGMLIPIRHGIDFLDVRMVLAYAFIPMLFVASPVAIGFAMARQSASRIFAWLSGSTLFGWCIGFVFLTTALATVNFVYRPPVLQLPQDGVLPLFAIFSAASVWFIVAASAFLSVLFSPGSARQAMRLGFLVLLLTFYAGPGALPSRWQYELGQFDPKSLAGYAAALLSLAAAGLTNALLRCGGVPATTGSPPAEPSIAPELH
jgi:hypothetical protein